MIPKTAGKFLNEDDLRAYAKCSRYYHLGGEHTEEHLVAIIRYVFEALTSHSIRKDIKDTLYTMQKYIYRSMKELKVQENLLDSQVQTLHRKATLILSEIFLSFSLDQYLPVYGPFEYNTKVNKTPVTLKVSGLYRSKKNQTLHIVCFTPYTHTHAALNDPVMQLKLQTLKHVVKPHGSGRPQAKLHIFGLNSKSNLFYTSQDSRDINKTTLHQVTQLVTQIETGNHFPLVPCPYMCKYKQNCYPEKQHE